MAAILNKIKMLVGAGTSAVSSGATEGIEETMKKELCALMQKDKDEITGIVTKAIGDKIAEDKTIIQPIIDAVRDMLMQSTEEIKADVTDADQADTTTGLDPALGIPAVPAEGIPAVPAEGIPAVPAEDIPAVPAEGVPAVPAEGVPAVPAEGVPDVPDVPAALSLAAIPGASGLMDGLKLQAPALPSASGVMDSLKSQAPALPSASGLMSGLTDKIPAIPGASNALSTVANLSGATTALNAASTASSLPGVSSLANLTGATSALNAASQAIKPAENTTGGARRKTSRRKKRTLKKPKYGPRCKTLFYKNGGRKRRKTCRSRK
jgi:hypothetical protein